MLKRRKSAACVCRVLFLFVAGLSVSPTFAAKPSDDVAAALKSIGATKGVCSVLGLPTTGQTEFLTELAANSEFLIYFQSPNLTEVMSVRQAADAAGLLGERIFVEQGDWKTVHLASNLVDAVIVGDSAKDAVSEKELLRILRPKAKALVAGQEIVKPVPAGFDYWNHPYHRPDNNPQSTDQLARAPYRTQFLADPKFSPMPEVSVAAGGRIFKAFGHIAHKANQNPILNTLMCINAYNGTVNWKRKLQEGFMIHRSTMIATDDALYMGDAESCKIIDAVTGKVRDEIVIPKGLGDGPVWKWMGLQDGVLYALVGNPEIKVDTMKSARRGLGHWPWSMWKGHDYKNPHLSFGYGRTFVAINPKTKEILWQYDEKDFIDSRGLCMKNGRIYYCCPEKFLACVDADAGKLLWKNSDKDLLEAIGPNQKAQHYVTGYATTNYIKCNDDYIFFAGPQRKQLVVASAKDGKLAWAHPNGNLQLVLRDDGLYCAGPKATGVKLDYATGKELAKLPTRRACTRATASVDSIFYRTSGGTVRLDLGSNTAQHIAPMRPPCQDGVIISNGLLYWGPWMCGCQLSLYGHISLAPAGDVAAESRPDGTQLTLGTGDLENIAAFEVRSDDWPTYRGNNNRSGQTQVTIPVKVAERWSFKPPSDAMPTAPVVAGDTVFVADRAGVLRALDTDGKQKWQAYTGGAIYYAPSVANGRVFVGSADGRVHAFEAATGRLLWTYRVAPGKRWISVYGKLISTWPVSGGVIVENDTVYAAAGIAHYDGTHVVALDAATGTLKWHNDSSGAQSKEVNSGVSLQGSLCMDNGELCFLAGGVYETARFDPKTARCLNEPQNRVTSQFRTAFYAYYPEYGKYLSLDHTFDDGKTLSHDASYEGSQFTNLSLLGPLPPGTPKTQKLASRWGRRGNKIKRDTVWQDKSNRRFTSFVVAPGTLLAAGHIDAEQPTPFLTAISTKDGKDVWQQELPANVVKGGTAVDHAGRIVLALEDGKIVCFAAKE